MTTNATELGSATGTTTGTTTWAIDATHTAVEFSVKHLMISTVRGRFSEVKGTVTVNEADASDSVVDVEIAAASIDTRNEQRDAHLRSADFLDAERFPTLTVRSTKIEGDTKGDFRLLGELTIRGVTRPITLDVTFEGATRDPWGGDRLGFSARGKLQRSAFGLTWNAALETGGVVVGDELKLTIDVELVKQA